MSRGETLHHLSQAIAERIKKPVRDPKVASEKKVVFLFTGQGSQWVGMGAAWYEQEPAFREMFEYCLQGFSAQLGDEIDIGLLRNLVLGRASSGQEETLSKTLYSQIALFSTEYALAHCWKRFGIRPQAVMGHSIGECVAAVIAGVLSIDDGIVLVAHRARLMQSLESKGTMMAVQSSKAIIEDALQKYRMEDPECILVIAADNAPNQVVVSGEVHAVTVFAEQYLKPANIRYTPLAVSNAFHSECMQPMVSEFLSCIARLTYCPPQVPLMANVTGQWAQDTTIDAHYWVRQVLQAVRCQDGFEALFEDGFSDFLEIGPRPILLQFGQQILRAAPPEKEVDAFIWASSLNARIQPQGQAAYQALASFYEAGYSVDWKAFHASSALNSCRKVVLPTYHFIRQRHWPKALEQWPSQLHQWPIAVETTPANEGSIDHEVIIIGGVLQD